MKQIKPGRGPSMMSGIMGIFAVLFGIVWTINAAQAGGLFALFGVIWTIMAIVQTVYNFKNATSKDRYSSFDIVDGNEESDPLNQRFGSTQQPSQTESDTVSNYCPYCGMPVDDRFIYCNHCGKKLP